MAGVDGDEVTEGIPDPYADQSPRIAVPEKVYTQEAPYDTSVVEIGEKVTPPPISPHLLDVYICHYDMKLRLSFSRASSVSRARHVTEVAWALA